MGRFNDIANKMVLYKMKTAWLALKKNYNIVADKEEVSLSMAFVLLAINNERGSTVTSIAPRIGMEPNSLSRILKSLMEKKYIYKKKSDSDKRKVFICLTDLGMQKQSETLKKVFNLENNIINSVSKKDLIGFFNVIKNIHQHTENN